MSTYVTNRAETMVKESRDGVNDSQVRQRKPRTPENVWIPCEVKHCKEGIFTKKEDEMVIFTWAPLDGGREIETAIILDKPPFMEDTILDVMLPDATNDFKFADLVGKGAAIKVTFNGNYTNLVDIAPLNEQEEARLQAKKKAETAKKLQQQRDVEDFEEDMSAMDEEQPEVAKRRGFGSGRSTRGSSDRHQVLSQKQDELDELDESENNDEELEFDTEDDLDIDIDIDFDVDDELTFEEDEESESY